MRLIDANIPIYAVGSPHPYREPCRRLLEIVDEGNHDFMTDSEVLQEVLHVLHRRGRSSVGFELVSGLVWVTQVSSLYWHCRDKRRDGTVTRISPD